MNYQRGWRPKPEPHIPPDHDERVVLSVRAMERGEANKDQQLLFWDYLMYVTKASDEFQDLSYRPKNIEASTFAEGSRFVGIVIRALLRPEFDPQAAPPKPAEREVPSRPVRLTRAQRKQAKA